MIVSITFRHGTDISRLRHWVNQKCYDLTKYTQQINRVEVVFSKESHRENSASSITCHISVHASGRKQFDVFGHHRDEATAFSDTLDRIIAKLSHHYSGRGLRRRVAPLVPDQTDRLSDLEEIASG